MFRKIIVCTWLSFMPVVVYSAADPLADIDLGGAGDILKDVKDGLTSQQDKIVDAAAKAQNAKASDLANSIISEPLSAKEAACLDQILDIDLSVFKVGGVGSIWDAVYKMIMDQIRNLTCSAASDWAKDQTSRVDDMMSDGFDFDDMDDIWSGGTGAPQDLPDVGDYVGTSDMGKVPEAPGAASSNGGMQYQQGNQSENARDLSDKMGEMVEKNIFWGDK